MKKDFIKIDKEISVCTKCPLSKSRINAVPGDGNIFSKIFILGEAPGHEEDLQKKTFVGKSGKILDAILSACNLSRKDIYITNTVKCRPPKNRAPKQLEIRTCQQYLIRQLNIIKPSIIIALGSVATAEIFKMYGLSYNKISFLHGKAYQVDANYGKIKIVPSYHPAAALRNPKILHLLKNDLIKNYR